MPARIVIKPFRLFLCLIIIGAAFVQQGCETYHGKPIDLGKVTEHLASPDLSRVQISADKLKHPLFKSIRIDLADGLSPDEAAILAVILNPKLRAIRDQKGIASAQVLEAGLLPNPQLSISLEIPFGAGTSDKIMGEGLGLDWDIYSLVTRQARIAAARFFASSVNLAVAWKEWQVAEKAKLEFYRLVFARQKNSIYCKLVETYQRLYRLMSKGLSLGQETVFDVSNSEYALKRARTALLKSQEQLSLARLALNRAIGLPPEYNIYLQKPIWVSSAIVIPPQDELLRDIQKTRLDLIALRLGYNSQDARLKQAIRGQFPRISLSLSGSKDTDGIKSIGPSITIDLPFFNHNQGKIAIERATRQRLYDEYVARVFGARADVVKISQQIRHIQQQIDEQAKLIRNIRKKTESYRKASVSGLLSKSYYYTALTNLYQTQLNQLEKKTRLAELELALELATGRYKAGHSTTGFSRPGRTAKGDGK